MFKTIKNIVFLATFALAATFVYAGEPVVGTSWRITEQTDEITDAVSYLIVTMARESNIKSPFPEITIFGIRIEPMGLTKNNRIRFKQKIFIHHQNGSLGVDTTRITTRFNREKATTSTWLTLPPSYELAVATDSGAMFSKIETSTNLIVRLTTIIGETKTLTFDIGGFTSAFDKVKAKYFATNPPTIPDAMPAATPPPQSDVRSTKPARKTTAARKPAAPPCSKCKGKRTISGWKPCPNCNGAVMPGGSRCKTCIKSIHVGKIRGEIPCPVCRPDDATANLSSGFGRSR